MATAGGLEPLERSRTGQIGAWRKGGSVRGRGGVASRTAGRIYR